MGGKGPPGSPTFKSTGIQSAENVIHFSKNCLFTIPNPAVDALQTDHLVGRGRVPESAHVPSPVQRRVHGPCVRETVTPVCSCRRTTRRRFCATADSRSAGTASVNDARSAVPVRTSTPCRRAATCSPTPSSTSTEVAPLLIHALSTKAPYTLPVYTWPVNTGVQNDPRVHGP